MASPMKNKKQKQTVKKKQTNKKQNKITHNYIKS